MTKSELLEFPTRLTSMDRQTEQVDDTASRRVLWRPPDASPPRGLNHSSSSSALTSSTLLHRHADAGYGVARVGFDAERLGREVCSEGESTRKSEREMERENCRCGGIARRY